MDFERKLVNYGGSTLVTLPPDVVKFLDLKEGDSVVIRDETKKYGRFVSIWKKV